VVPSAAQPTVLPIPTGRNIGYACAGSVNPIRTTSTSATPSPHGLTADLRVRYEVPTEEGVIASVILTNNCGPSTCAISINQNRQEIVNTAVLDAIHRVAVHGRAKRSSI